MKKLLLVLLFLGTACNAFSQTLHAIMVSDVEDSELGGVSLNDEEKIMQILKTAKWGTGLNLKTYYLNRSSFTAKAVRDTLDKMRVGSRDIVFFYYTGPGYYPGRSDKFPTFKLKGNALQTLLFFINSNTLSLDEVGDLLQDKGARLNVVMADCRDTLANMTQVPASVLADEDVSGITLKKLFLGSCGLVKVASSKNGKRVWAEKSGSVYTENFSITFEMMLLSQFNGVRRATWPQLLQSTESIGIYLAGDDFRKPDTQEAIFETKTCTAAQRRHTTRYASYEHSITSGGIGRSLENYKIRGGDYEKISREIVRAFYRNTQVELIRQNKYPASDARAKRLTERMSIDQYLARFKKVASQIKYIDTDISSVRRTPNKEYLTGLTFIETYDEL